MLSTDFSPFPVKFFENVTKNCIDVTFVFFRFLFVVVVKVCIIQWWMSFIENRFACSSLPRILITHYTIATSPRRVELKICDSEQTSKKKAGCVERKGAHFCISYVVVNSYIRLETKITEFADHGMTFTILFFFFLLLFFNIVS